MCRKNLTKRQKFKKANNFRQANEMQCLKNYNHVRQMESRTFVRTVK